MTFYTSGGILSPSRTTNNKNTHRHLNHPNAPTTWPPDELKYSKTSAMYYATSTDPIHNFHFLHISKMVRFSLGDICIMKRRSTLNNGTFRSSQSPYRTCYFQNPLWLNTSNIQALFGTCYTQKYSSFIQTLQNQAFQYSQNQLILHVWSSKILINSWD